MLSYSRGPDEPLWEKTIGQVLDQTVEQSGNCLALVSRHQPKRYNWREVRALADCARVVVARDQARRSRWPVVHKLRGMDDGPSGLRPCGSGLGERESGLSRA